jgi:hypothetical protein
MTIETTQNDVCPQSQRLDVLRQGERPQNVKHDAIKSPQNPLMADQFCKYLRNILGPVPKAKLRSLIGAQRPKLFSINHQQITNRLME